MGSDLNSFDYLIKILLIGNPGVGKSSLIYRYCEAKFPLKVNSTKGIKFKTKIVTKNDRRMNLQIWVFIVPKFNCIEYYRNISIQYSILVSYNF